MTAATRKESSRKEKRKGIPQRFEKETKKKGVEECGGERRD